MRQAQVSALRPEEVAKPIPAARGFDHGLTRARELREVVAEQVPVVRDRELHHALALRREGREDGARAMLIDASVEHRTLPSDER